MTFKIACAVSKLVKLIVACSTASRRILNPSERGLVPEVSVLMTNWTFPFLITDNTFGSSVPILATSVTGKPFSLKNLAVPLVANKSKPKLWIT